MAEYPINKGIGRPVEFKGLKAQYLFIFCGGLLALFVLFVILYMVGIDTNAPAGTPPVPPLLFLPQKPSP